MPKFLNQYNLPEPLRRALTFDDYSKGNADISVTELLKSPRQRLLAKRHDAEIAMDASENMWLLMGRAVHQVLQLAANKADGGFEGLVEERLYTTVKGPSGTWILSGAFDLLYRDKDDLVLADYKVTSVYSLIFEKENGGIKKEWEQQLNILRWLLHLHGFKVARLEVGAILRDWKHGEFAKSAASKKTDYPQCPVVVLPVSLWALPDVERFVTQRVTIHQFAEHSQDNDLPQCAPQERWARDDKWAVFEGAKSKAFRVFDNESEARLCHDELAKTVKSRIEFRAGKSNKCALYCWGSKFCNQYAEETARRL